MNDQPGPIWLGEEPGYHAALLRPKPSGVVRLWPVSRAVNSVRIDEPELLLPMVDPAPQMQVKAAEDLNPE